MHEIDVAKICVQQKSATKGYKNLFSYFLHNIFLQHSAKQFF